MSDIHGIGIPKLKHKNDNIANFVNVGNLRKTRIGFKRSEELVGWREIPSLILTFEGFLSNSVHIF